MNGTSRRLGYLLLTVFLTVPAHVGAQLPDPARNPRRIRSQSGLDNLGQAVSSVFDVLIVLLPTVAALYLAISGYRYMVAQGNPDLVDRAKKSLLYAVYGFVAALVSVALIFLVSQVLGFNSGLRL